MVRVTGARTDASSGGSSDIGQPSADPAMSPSETARDQPTAAVRDLTERLTAEQRRVQELSDQLDAMTATVSWRLTRPLRALRRRMVRRRPGGPDRESEVVGAGGSSTAPSAVRADVGEQAQRLAHRVDLVVGLLAPSRGPIDDAMQGFVALDRALESTEIEGATAAWLAVVGATGSYPDSAGVETAARVLRLDGPGALCRHVEALYSEAIGGGRLLPEVEILRDRVLVDVTHTSTFDFHTGIQRVTRECVSRWLTRPGVELIHWSQRAAAPKRLSDREAERLGRWREYLHRAGEHVRSREPDEATGSTIIPWGCVLVVPEFVDSAQRSESYTALSKAGITSALSLIGYDLTPVTASEFFEPDMTQTFVQYLRLVRHATDICAISESAAQEFRSFLGVLVSQGIAPPMVTAAPLTSVPSAVDDDTMEAARRLFGVGARKLVLAVGSHEPRKNHLSVLEAASTLWKQGLAFDLVFVGGSTWKSTEFERYADELRSEGRSIQVHRRVSEDALWSLYRLADLSVFVSFQEGYGLPVAESLASGTPVITSDYGAMAEVAAGGGALQVDPRDPQALATAMHELLTDDERLDALRAEAGARSWPTWDDYADDVWRHLVEAPRQRASAPVRRSVL